MVFYAKCKCGFEEEEFVGIGYGRPLYTCSACHHLTESPESMNCNQCGGQREELKRIKFTRIEQFLNRKRKKLPFWLVHKLNIRTQVYGKYGCPVCKKPSLLVYVDSSY